jgi:hypothetical protein
MTFQKGPYHASERGLPMSDEQNFEHFGVNVQDEDPESPRNWDNLGTLALFHKRYNLGDKGHGYRSEDYAGWEAMKAAMLRDGAAIVLSVYMMDHSGISIRCDSSAFRACDSAGWDWGQIGFVFVMKDKLRKEYGKLTRKNIETATKVLLAEVETYNQFLSGDVWGYIVDQDGKDESCWGYYSFDECVEEAKNVAKRIAGERFGVKALLETPMTPEAEKELQALLEKAAHPAPAEITLTEK